MLTIAHRGASGYAPENTRAAFERAIEMGADMVETDVQLTLDGELVLIHDDHVDREDRRIAYVINLTPRWRPDWGGMLHFTAEDGSVLDTFFLEADATPNPGGIPVGGQTRLDIPNDHLQYALTWFLIALAGIGVYLAYHWEQGRLTVNGRTKVKGR